MSNIKPLTLEDLDYEVVKLKKDMDKVRGLYDKIDWLKHRIEENEQDPTLLDVFKVWIRRFLDVERRWHD